MCEVEMGEKVRRRWKGERGWRERGCPLVNVFPRMRLWSPHMWTSFNHPAPKKRLSPLKDCAQWWKRNAQIFFPIFYQTFPQKLLQMLWCQFPTEPNLSCCNSYNILKTIGGEITFNKVAAMREEMREVVAQEVAALREEVILICFFFSS